MIQEGTAPATEEELREELSGNLCRCTGYQSIVEGVTEAIRRTVEIGSISAVDGGAA
jgi:aerobic-type carbon monoxide dehydrogenase small subunit (CoxS/CutS family)